MRAKDSQRRRRMLRSLAVLVLSAGAARSSAQSIYLPQTEEQRLSVPHVMYFDSDVEVEHNSYSSGTGGGTTYSDRIYTAPTVGVGWDYFLYHPDLMTFSVLAEPGYTWQKTDNNGSSSKESAWLLKGRFTGLLLRKKPYATTLTYNREHDNYNYDFFNSATVDTEIWGVNTGYRTGPVPVVVDYSHAHRDSSGLNYDTVSDSDTVSVTAQNARQNNNLTVLTYQFSNYSSDSSTVGTTNATPETFATSSTLQTLNITDTENIGRGTLGSSLYYEHVDSDGLASDNLNVGLDYSFQHTPNLRSFYDYQFAYFSQDSADNKNQYARAGLQHQLYESLVSSADVHGSTSANDSPGSSVDTYSVGTSGSLSYSKRLAGWGHLSLTDSATYDLTQQDTSGSQQFISNESHVVPLNLIFFLDQPNDLTWVSLTDSSGAITYVQGQDYDVITTSNPWQIRCYSTGPNNIVQGQVVKANYFSQPNPSGDYTTFNNSTQLRLDFWNNHAGIFARYYFTDNQSGTPSFILEDVNELQAGGDMNWNRLRISATYTDRNSSYAQYQSVTTAEGYTLLATAKNSASLNFNQQWSTYPGSGTNTSQNVDYYSWTGRYEWHPAGQFNWASEAGYQQQHGGGTDQDFIVARTSIGWRIGKLDLRVGYEYQNQQYPSETRQRNFAWLRLRRNF